MGFDIDRLMDQYDRGVISRRQLVKGMFALTATALGARDGALTVEAAPAAIAPTLSINHVHVNVSDLKRSEEFYTALFGATVRERGDGITTMVLPCSTKTTGAWLSLTSVDGPIGRAEGGNMKAGTYNHCGFAVDMTQAKRIVGDLRKAYPSIKIPEANRTDQMNVYDPDGLRVQLMQLSHDGYIASESVPDGKGGKKNVAKYKPGEHI
jgi:catechol 2,3-dioxygenase-like lactoylglutathione lyase family enzyme